MSRDRGDLPPHLRPFVLPHEPVGPVRTGALLAQAGLVAGMFELGLRRRGQPRRGAR